MGKDREKNRPIDRECVCMFHSQDFPHKITNSFNLPYHLIHKHTVTLSRSSPLFIPGRFRWVGSSKAFERSLSSQILPRSHRLSLCPSISISLQLRKAQTRLFSLSFFLLRNGLTLYLSSVVTLDCPFRISNSNLIFFQSLSLSS